jgi:hypothetical protein
VCEGRAGGKTKSESMAFGSIKSHFALAIRINLRQSRA